MEQPSLEELKQRCFKQNIDPSLKKRYKKSWALYYALTVTHYFSIRIVHLIYSTTIKPNQVTYASFLAGWLGGLCYLLPGNFWVLPGFLLFEFFYIMDAVDGQLARARGQGSIGGAFLDDCANYLVPAFVLFCLGLRAVNQGVPALFAYLAAFASMALSLIEILKDRRLFLLKKKEGTEKQPEPTDNITEEEKVLSPARLVYALLYRSCTMPVIMNLVTTASILTLLGVRSPFGQMDYLSVLVIYYATAGTAVWMTKGVHTAGSF